MVSIHMTGTIYGLDDSLPTEEPLWSWDKAPHPNPLPEGEGTCKGNRTGDEKGNYAAACAS